MKLCKDCKYFRPLGDFCSHGEPPSTPDYIHGGQTHSGYAGMQQARSAQALRMDRYQCGPDARWFIDRSSTGQGGE